MRLSSFSIVALTALPGVANAQESPLANQEPPAAIEQLPSATRDVFELLDEGWPSEPPSSWPCSGATRSVPNPQDRVYTLRVLPPLANGIIRNLGPCGVRGRYLRHGLSAFPFDELPLEGSGDVPGTPLPQDTPGDDVPAPRDDSR